MTESRCIKCGSELLADSAGGLCPACLLGIAINADHDTLAAVVADPDVPSLVGTRIRYFGDYELLGEIARGGMGIVYRARQMSLNRIVAVKMMRPGLLASEAEIQRFRVEAEAAAGLQHPGIIAIHEVGEHDGLCYFSMDYVEGKSLAQIVRDRPLSTKRAAGYVRTIAQAVEFAHQRGVLHRDLKPANVIIDSADAPRITDFGLARRLENDPGLTETGALVGTPSYMPPEQAAGKRDQLGPASDVYSTGAILYELLTGRPPFQADTPVNTAALVIHSEPVAPRMLNPGLNRDVETICLKCLEKDPRRRYRSAQELADDLGRFLNNQPIKARPVGVAGRTVRWCKRNPWPATAAAVLALLAIVAALVAMSSRERLWQSLLEQARSERLAGNRTRSLEILREAAAMKNGDELKREAIQTITTPGARLRQRIPFSGWRRVIVSQDSKLLVVAGSKQETGETRTPTSHMTFVTSKSKIEIWELETGRLLSQIDYPSSQIIGAEFALSPNQPILAGTVASYTVKPNQDASQENELIIDSRSVWLWNITTGEKAGEIKCQGNECRDLQEALIFSPDGGRLLRCSDDCTALLIDVAAGTGEPCCIEGTPIAFLSNDDVLLSDEDQLKSWNLTTRKCEALAPEYSEVLSVTRDANFALISSDDSLLLWDVRAGKEIAVVATIQSDGTDALLSANGKVVAVVNRKERNIIHIYDIAGRGVDHRTIALGSNRKIYLSLNEGALSPDGSLLAAFGGEGSQGSVWVWETRTGSEVGVLREHHLPVWTNDGRLLITAGPPDPTAHENNKASLNVDGIHAEDSSVNVLDLFPPTPEYLLPSGIDSIAFTPEGRLLANGHSWDFVNVQDRVALVARPAELPPESSALQTGDQVWMRVPVRDAMLKLVQLAPEHREISLQDPGYSGVKTAMQGKLYGSPSRLAVSPDGTRLVAASTLSVRYPSGGASSNGDTALELWDLNQGRRLAIWNEDSVHSGILAIKFSPDGRLVATAPNTNSGIIIRDAATGKQLRLIKNPQLSYALMFSPDGRFLYSAGSTLREGEEAPIFVYEVETGRAMGEWKGHHTSVVSLAESLDGKMLASGGGDGLICLRDAATGRKLADWEAHKMTVTALSFSRDGMTLASGSADGTLKLWNLPFIRRELKKLGLEW